MGSGRGTVPLAGIAVAAFRPAQDDGFVDRDDESNFLDDPPDRGPARKGDRMARGRTRAGRSPLTASARPGGETLWKGVPRTLVDRGASAKGTREMNGRDSSPTTAGPVTAADEETAVPSG
jgi:hypothetical protein